MRVRSTAVAALATALLAPVLVLATAQPASAACPKGTVGRLQTVYDPDGWVGSAEEVTVYFREGLGQSVASTADLVVDVAIWPFDKARNRFTVEAQTGHDFLEVGMHGGTVDLGSSTATGYYYEQDVLTYQPNVWNHLRVRFDLDKQKAHIRLNGQEKTVDSAAGTSVYQIWWNGFLSTPAQDTQTGYLDNLTLSKVTSSGTTRLFVENFEDQQAEAPYPGSWGYVEPTWFLATGSGCRRPSSVTIDEQQTSDRIRLFGAVTPSAPGGKVTASLFRKADGEFVRVGKARTVTLGSASAWSAGFDQPARARTCKGVVKFAGTSELAGSSRSTTFAC